MTNDSSQTSQNKLSSPDELDKLVRITKPSSWILIFTMSAFALIVIVWAIWGSIPQKIYGLGIITSNTGIHRITSVYPGAVAEIFYAQGDTVLEGMTLMRINQPELFSQIQELNLQLKALQFQDSLLNTADFAESSAKAQSYKLQQNRAKKEIDNLHDRISFYEDKLKKQKELLDKGLITVTEFEGTRETIKEFKLQIVSTEQLLKEIDLGQTEWEYAKKSRKTDLTAQISVLTKKIENLKEEYERQTLIRSNCDGIIVDQLVSAGDVVSPNASLYVIEEFKTQDNYILELYIPFNSDAKVEVGQLAQVNPFSVNKEKYGQIIGKVLKVNKYPSSTASLMDDLKNDALVNLLNSQGPRYKVIVQLDRDPLTISGFKWSSKYGPPFKVSTGTVCQGSVLVRDKSPLDLIIPLFKEYLGN